MIEPKLSANITNMTTIIALEKNEIVWYILLNKILHISYLKEGNVEQQSVFGGGGG